MHVWCLNKWKSNIDSSDSNLRKGLRLRFDSDVDPEVKRACKQFAIFLRQEYYFPIRVVIYVKSGKKIRAMDGEWVVGTFWSMPDDYTISPYIKISAGDYYDMCKKWDKDRALTAILLTMGHELTHYFQWINSVVLTPKGIERQASSYARYILEEYAETREHP